MVGDTQTAAASAITAAGLTVGNVTTAPNSSSVPIGDVASENPAATTQVNIGSAIGLVVSTGVAVPSVAGLTQSAATTAIATAGLTLGTVTKASSGSVPSGDVISQYPTPATQVNGGSAVNIVVSTGPQQVAVPNVIGDPQTAAASAITAAGLTIGNVTTANSGTVPAGDVVRESPSAATSVNIGSAVNLVISTGPAQYLLTTAASPSAGGTVAPLTGLQTASSVVQLTATPAPGYVFAGWAGPVANATANPTTVTMSGSERVTANFVSALTISPSTIDFGTVYLGTVHTKSITLTNTGTTPIKLDKPIFTGITGGSPNEFFVGEDCDCGSSLKPKGSCSIKVIFIAGPYFTPQTAQLKITDNAPGSPQLVPIHVTAIDPVPHLSATSLSFAPQDPNTISSGKTITFTNIGDTEVTIDSILVGGAEADDFEETNTCPAALSAKRSCTIDVKFKPVSAGSKSAKLLINDNAQGNQQTIWLSGTGK